MARERARRLFPSSIHQWIFDLESTVSVFLTRIAAILWVCASSVCVSASSSWIWSVLLTEPVCGPVLDSVQLSKKICLRVSAGTERTTGRNVHSDPTQTTAHRLFEESLKESCFILWISQLWDVWAVVWVVIFLKGGGANRPFRFDLHSCSLKNLWNDHGWCKSLPYNWFHRHFYIKLF